MPFISPLKALGLSGRWEVTRPSLLSAQTEREPCPGALEDQATTCVCLWGDGGLREQERKDERSSAAPWLVLGVPGP